MIEEPRLRSDPRIDDIISELETAGIVTTTLGELRDRIANVDRLGKHVLALIENNLTTHGIGYFPMSAFSSDAPRQHQEVRLYIHDSAIGKVVDAVLQPSSAGDKVLKNLHMDAPKRSEVRDMDAIRQAVASLQTADALLRDFLDAELAPAIEEGR